MCLPCGRDLKDGLKVIVLVAAVTTCGHPVPVAASAYGKRDCATLLENDSRTIFVSMDGGPHRFHGEGVGTVALEEALSELCSGDVVQLVEDDYRLDGRIANVRRSTSDWVSGPIILRGLQAATTINGGTSVGYRIGDSVLQPTTREHACFRLEGQHDITIEAIDFAECWPVAVHALNSRYITLRDSRIVGSTFGMYAVGSCQLDDGRCVSADRGDTAHHYLVEGVQWIQDPAPGALPPRGFSSGAGRLWRRYWWEDVHDLGRPYDYLNGALFGSWNILGGLVFRYNRVENAFNGVRLDLPRKFRPATRNLNIEIYGNWFRYVRDNPIEPEHEATNLWVHHNRFFNTHATFSTDGVGGNYWYLFGNVGWFDEAPNRECHLDPRCRECLRRPECAKRRLHRRSKALKAGLGPFPGEAFYVFHNSTYARGPNAAGGETRHIKVLNNAIQVCRQEDHDPGDCTSHDAFENFCYHKSYSFEGNVSNDAGCMRRCGSPVETPPVCAYPMVYDALATPCFINPIAGDLRLGQTSPAHGAAVPVQLALPDRSVWSAEGGELDRPRDAGAYQDSHLYAGPAFVLYEPDPSGVVDGYPERPRIVRLTEHRDGLRWRWEIFFSVPVRYRGHLVRPNLSVETGKDDSQRFVTSNPCEIFSRRLVCDFDPGLDTSSGVHQIWLARGIESALEKESLPMTLWGSVEPRIIVPPRNSSPPHRGTHVIELQAGCHVEAKISPSSPRGVMAAPIARRLSGLPAPKPLTGLFPTMATRTNCERLASYLPIQECFSLDLDPHQHEKNGIQDYLER